MKHSMKTISICIVLVPIMLLPGCVSKQDMQRDLTIARRDALREWSRTKEHKKDGAFICGDLTLRKALELSLSHNRMLQVVIEEKNVAKGRILEAYQGVLPNVSLSGTYTRLDTDYIDVDGDKRSIGQLDNYSGEISVLQPLFRGGAATAALKASNLYDLLADENVRKAMQDTIYETTRAYYQACLVREQYNVTMTYTKLAEAHLKDVEIKRRFGTASDFNVLRSQVELSNSRAEMINYKNRLHKATTYLLQTIGISQESRIKLADSLTFKPISVEEEESVRGALMNRPDLVVAQLAEGLQKESLNNAYSEYWPAVTGFYNHALGKPDPYISTRNEWNDAWNAGIKVDISLFDGLGREGRVIKERASLKQRHIELLDTRERILFEVRNAVLSLNDAAESVNVQNLTLEQAAEGLRLAEVGYREGTLDQVSVLDARAALTQAQLLYYRSLYDHALARLDLQKAMGNLTPEKEEKN